MVTVRAKAIVILLLAAWSVACAAQSKPKQIAELWVTTKATAAYSDKSNSSERIVSLGVGTKLVVLSSSKEWARIAMAETEVGYVPVRDIKKVEGITLEGAKTRVRYFERMRSEHPESESSYEYQAAPWVRLITIELGKQKTAELPEPVATYSNSSEAPSLTIINNTGRELSIYLNGPAALSFTLPPSGRTYRVMRAGTYRVFATVNDPLVIPLRSTWKLQLGYTHDITLYID